MEAIRLSTLDTGSHINAGPELQPEAGARHDRTLEVVSSRPLLGAGSATDFRCASLVYDGFLAGAQFLSGGHRHLPDWIGSQFDRGASSVA
jgi:hypothetical protein